ncbi:MAG TPA: hypothetical protein VIM00_14075 [Candidatus Acidoferrum sp.]|jgi:hypothetical protein
MRSVRVTTLGTVLLASALPVVGAVLVIVDHPRSASAAAPELIQSQLHLDVRTMAGKISRHNGKYTFHDERHGLLYTLDDQLTAKKFSGHEVLLTGTVDGRASRIEVHKIEATQTKID